MADQFRPIARSGWGCHLVLERLPEPPLSLAPIEELGVTFHVAARPRFTWDAVRIAGIRRLCRKVRPQLLVCDNIHVAPLLGAWLAGVPSRIWIKRSMNAHFENCKEPAFRERLALSTRVSGWLATRIVAVSGAVKAELVDLGVPGANVVVRLNPRRLESTAPTSPASRSAVRTRFGYTDADFVFVTVGHAVKVKGWDLLLTAFAAIAAEAPHTRLLLIGGTKRPDEIAFASTLTADTARLGLESRVTFTGHVESVGELLSAGDVFVLPSRSEGCCNALVEAMESGLPCIATRVGSAGDLLTSGVNGLLVERNDDDALASAMRTIVHNKQLLAQFRAASGVPDIVPSQTGYVEQLCADFVSSVPLAQT